MATILESIAAGDERAVERCVAEYGGLVWRLARRYLGESRAETEDAVQEVFVSIWLSAARFDPARGSEPAFVATIAHRRLNDARRRRISRREISAASLVEPRAKVAGSAHGRLEGSDARRAVASAFDTLPADERHALWMSVWGGLSHSQISEATGVAIGTIKSRLRRGVRRLHESVHALEGAGGEERS